MSSVTFSTSVGGDGSTVTDDNNASTGLRDGGWKTRFIPCFTQQVAVAGHTVTTAGNSATSATASATSATASATSATAAAASATAAAASAASAAAIAGAFVSTSTTTWTPATGSKAFTVQSDEQYTAGIFVTVVSASDPSNWGFGQVTSYSGTTLTVDVQVISGSTSKADWNISLAGSRGATGATGAAGTGVTAQSIGFTLTGGTTTSKTLTVDTTLATSSLATTGKSIAMAMIFGG